MPAAHRLPLFLSGALATLLLASCAAAQQPATARAMLKTADGQPAGTARFSDTPQGMEIGVEAEGLKPGPHGMHVHQNPDCAPGADSATGKVVPFGAAGGHFDPLDTKNHGKPNGVDAKSHAGDLPMLEAGADGRAKLSHVTRRLGVAPSKTSVVGRTLIIHEQADDYESDPAGNSGGRVLCGLIEAAKPTGVAAR